MAHGLAADVFDCFELCGLGFPQAFSSMVCSTALNQQRYHSAGFLRGFFDQL
jgi:hypothetical protein